MSYLRYLFTILLTLTMFYGWASPSVATSQFVCRGVGLTEPERSSLWNLSDVSTLDKAGLNLAPRYVATSVHDGDSVRTIISEIIDGRRMRYLVDGSNLIWIGEETPEMHIRVDTLCYTSALLPFGDVSIPLSLYYRSNVIRTDGTLVQSATYYPYGEPHRDPAASATIGIAGPEQQTASATFSNPYLYGGKEYVRRDGLREYIYGARMFVSSETRFNSADELCELRPWESPYLFCGGNPIRYVDDSGNDYHVKVNHEEQTITISADYYAYRSDAQSVTAAIGFWNDLSGKYAMDGYTINFALAYHEVEPYKTGGKELDQRKSINYAMGGDASANAYMVIHDGESSSVINEDGQTSSGGYNNREISISERNAVELTGAHEVGHSLGLLHSDYGLMYPLGNSYKRTSDVSKSEVKAIIKQAFTGKVPKDGKEAEPGRGYLDNEEEIKKIEWKYEVRKKQ